ncbi:MAG: PQQ-binding-like beta-propeller repeat protein, partial [candidate division NC10 bacterium]|nr:PQQ-binding-like beta-propeller repeat protein [candidate division NC10 bacterium]
MSRPSGGVMCITAGAVAFGMLLLGAIAPHFTTVEAQSQPSPASLLAPSAWPKYRGDHRHAGYSPHTGPASNRLKWTFSTGRREAEGGIETDPVIGPDGTVYLGANNGFLYALDPETGDLRWAFPTGFDSFAIYSTPFVDRQGVLYFGAKDGNVYAL